MKANAFFQNNMRYHSVPNVRREKGKTNPLWEIRIRHFEGIYGDIVLYGMKSRIFLVDF